MNKMLIKGATYSACKHFPDPRKDFDCPLCEAELHLARTQTSTYVVSLETGTVTLDSRPLSMEISNEQAEKLHV